jgi:argininosuccinate lyase
MTEQKIWSGRFREKTASLMESFSTSVFFDQKLFQADIRVNKAWATSLQEIGVYSKSELDKVLYALDQIEREFISGQLTLSDLDEDIHSANERWLTEKIGPLGARIHTGRSRNDQVVTDLKIYLKDHLRKLEDAISHIQNTLVQLADQHRRTVLPGFTHLRQAQPISFAHYLLSLFFQLQRDVIRIKDTFDRCDVMPLGSGALAGAAFDIDREKLARTLGFSRCSENSIDATSDRDFVTEALFVASQVMLHLSRTAEDFIIWSSEPYRYIDIHETYSTGSSMMPQKKNPDSLELIRGKTARVVGDLTVLLNLMKGIPTAYVRDLQEDKEPLFDALEQTTSCCLIMAGVIASLHVDALTMLESLDPALYATDLADYLVHKGEPFRQAHHIVGQIVSYAEKEKKSLSECNLDEFRHYSKLFDRDVLELFDPQNALARRNLKGGTGPKSVAQQLETAKKILDDNQFLFTRPV